MLFFCNFIQVYVFTTNKVIVKILHLEAYLFRVSYRVILKTVYCVFSLESPQ